MVSTSTTTPGPGAGFIAIGRHVYLRPGQRDAGTANNTTKGPTAILIFGWMSAQLSHLHQYTRYYSEVYPQATQILVRSHPSFFFRTEKANDAVLAPVIEELEAAGCIAPSKPKGHVDAKEPARILVHAFSNGGAFGLTRLGRLLLRRLPSSQRLTSVIVLDSCPGNDGFGSTIKAFMTSITNPLMRIAFVLVLSLMYGYMTLLHILANTPPIFDVLKAALLNPRVVPWVDERSPRVYIFSKNDEMVPWQQVMAHAEKAKELGMDVRIKLYEQTSHVTHMRADPGTYWATIGEAWGDAWRADEAETSVNLEN